jgi:polyhydroxybutyrate depolymerase
VSIPRIRVAPVLIAIVLVSVACSDSESIDDGESSPTTTPTTTAADVPASAPSEAIPLGRSTHTIESAGLDREYIVIVPSSYDGSASMPLVFEFHGYSLWAEEQAAGSRLWTVGEREGFVTVLPEGRGDIQRWLFELDDADIDISPNNPDMKLVTDLIAHLSTELEIDADRIYAAGFSNGGWMASALACTFPDVFAAVAPVAGIMDFGDDCTDTPVPTVTFHGTADEYEPFVGGPEAVPARGELPTDLGGTYAELPINSNPLLEVSVPDKVALRASGNGCAPDPVTSSLSDVTTVSTFTCPDGAAVVYHEVEGGTHWWGISEQSGYDTNEVIWEFFASS